MHNERARTCKPLARARQSPLHLPGTAYAVSDTRVNIDRMSQHTPRFSSSSETTIMQSSADAYPNALLSVLPVCAWSDNLPYSRLLTLCLPGLRAAMQAGYACMNDLTVLQASQVRRVSQASPPKLTCFQGLCAYVLEHVPRAREKGVVIGHVHALSS